MKYTLFLFLAIAAVACLPGCGAEEPKIESARAFVTDLLVTPSKDDTSFKLTTDEHPFLVRVPYRVGIVSYEYKALVGEHSKGNFDADSAVLTVGGGWMYIMGNWPTGHYPHIRTTQVSAGCDGSALIAQVDEATHVHRIYLVSLGTWGTKATVKLNSDPTKFVELTSAGHDYAEYVEGATTIDKKTLPASGAIHDFYDHSTGSATDAGF